MFRFIPDHTHDLYLFSKIVETISLRALREGELLINPLHPLTLNYFIVLTYYKTTPGYVFHSLTILFVY